MADPALSGLFGQPFDEQVAALDHRLRRLAPTSSWRDLWQDQHDAAFVVAGATKADLLADLGGAVRKAVAEGTSLEEFRKDFRETVARHGWTGWTGEGSKAGEAWRTRVIYKTNMATSYAAGRWAQLVEGDFSLWIYRHGGSRDPRPQHLAWDGLTLPPDHPFWQTHAPPNGWGCSCYIIGARSEAAARRRGGDPAKTLPDGWRVIDGGTGAPAGIDKGWAYAPGASASDAIRASMAKIPNLPAELGAAMVAGMPGQASGTIAADFADFVDRSLAGHVQGNYQVVGALMPAWIKAAQARGVMPASAEIVVTDLNVQHTFRGTGLVTAPTTRRRPAGQQPKVDPLDIDWYKDLPAHLTRPRAVLLDTTSGEPVFLLIYDVPGSHAKLVVEINTWVKKAKGRLNTVQTGRLVDQRSIHADINRGVTVIDGEV